MERGLEIPNNLVRMLFILVVVEAGSRIEQSSNRSIENKLRRAKSEA